MNEILYQYIYGNHKEVLRATSNAQKNFCVNFTYYNLTTGAYSTVEI